MPPDVATLPAPTDQVKADFMASRAIAGRDQPSPALSAILFPKAPPAAAQETPVAATAQSAPASSASAPAASSAPSAAPAPAQTGAQPQYAMVESHPAPDGSGAYTNLSDADYYKFQELAKGSVVSDLPQKVGAAAADIGKGVIDAPRQVLGGVLDMGNNLMQFADTVVKKAEDAGVPNIYFRLVNKDGQWDPAMMSTAEFRAAQAAGTEGVFQVPTTGGPDTVTGGIIRAATTFMAAGAPVRAGAGAVGIGTRILSDFLGGSTGVDPNGPRLSNMIDQVAPNFLTDWLKAKPEEEGTLLAHLKTGLENAGMGAAVAGITRTLSAVKGAVAGNPELGQVLSATDQPGSSAGVPGADVGTRPLPPTDPNSPIAALQPDASLADIFGAVPEGDVGKPAPLPGNAVQIDPQFQDLAERFMRGETGTNPVRVNLDTIDSPEHVSELIARVSASLPVRGVQSWDQTNMMTHAFGMSAEDLMRGKLGGGRALDAVELRSAAMISQSVAQQAGDLARAALAPGATDADMGSALKAVGVQFQIAQRMADFEGEAGRALNILGQVKSATPPYVQAVNDLITKAGIGGGSNDLVSRIADLGDPATGGDPAKVSAYLASIARGGAADGKGWALYYNILLSNPATVVKKSISDLGMGLWNLAVHYTAEKAGSGAVPPGTAAEMAYGYVGAQRDALRLAGKALLAGESQFHPEASTMEGGKLPLLSDGAPQALDASAPTVAASQYLRAALPTSWIGAVDDWAKFSHFRAELRGLAIRDGVQKGLSGADLAGHIATTMDAAPQAMSEQAWSAALRSTFQEPLTGFAEKLHGARDELGIAGRVLVPFTKVPANIVKWSYTNSPLAAAFPTQSIRAELAAGGATRDLAIARMGLGGMVAWSMADLALNNQVTGRGPQDPELQRAWRAAGNEPYSLKFMGKSFGYNSIEPIGLMTGAIADTFDVMRFAHQQDADQVAASLMFGTGNAVMSKTYLSGLSQFFDALNNPQQGGSKYVDGLISSFVTPPGVAAAAQATDPWVRAHYDLLSQVESRLPYVSQGLPPARTLWGDPIPVADHYMPPFSGSGAARMLSPVPVVPGDGAAPIDKWIWDNRAAFPRDASDGRLGIRKPSETQSFQFGPGIAVNMKLDPDVHDRLQVLAGNELKDPRNGMGAKDALNALVQGNSPDTVLQDQWNKATPEFRALLVQHVVNTYRGAARKQLLTEFPALRDAVTTAAGMRRDQLAPSPATSPVGAAMGAHMPNTGGM